MQLQLIYTTRLLLEGVKSMAIELELSPAKIKDTIANHGTQTSGNTVFLSVPFVRTVKKPRDITDIADDIRKLDHVRPIVGAGVSTVDTEALAKLALEHFEQIERYTIASLSPPSTRANVRILIDRETAKLHVLSDCIGPALLLVLDIHGPLNTSQMSESLDITREVLISHLETLQTTGLVTLENGQYSISDDGVEFLRNLGLEEESR